MFRAHSLFILSSLSFVFFGCSGSDGDTAMPSSHGGWNSVGGSGGAAGGAGVKLDGGKTGADAKASVEKCGNGLDDDGNGQADDGCGCTAGKTQPCFIGEVQHAGIGACVMGSQKCTTNGHGENEVNLWGTCAGSGMAKAETCNGKDDDCDGVVDNGCACQDGQEKDCSTACGAGKQACVAGAWKACDAPAPQAEVCGDGIDQDCNGADEACPGSCTDGVQNQGETSVDCGGPCGSREVDVTFEMNHENSYDPGCTGTEKVVSVENTGGSWCAWSSSPDCPLTCPSATIQPDQKSIFVGGDTKWDDNSGSCSYRLHICGKP
ncbi:MAG: hypothetical protein HY898_16010 [Deltaproteobacteria bacterium]|nr:hypothetical protein [Deltaproteobacteria bacterium]